MFYRVLVRLIPWCLVFLVDNTHGVISSLHFLINCFHCFFFFNSHQPPPSTNWTNWIFDPEVLSNADDFAFLLH